MGIELQNIPTEKEHIEIVVGYSAMERNRGLFHEDIIRNAGQYFPSFGEHTTFVDFGCGSGNLCRDVAKYSGEVIGLDIRAHSVWRDYQREFGGQLKFFQRELKDSGLEDNIADFILCFHVLQYTPDKLGVINEAHRVLKPGKSAFFYYEDKSDLIDPSWETIEENNCNQLKVNIKKTPKYSIDRAPMQHVSILLTKKEEKLNLPTYMKFTYPTYFLNQVVVVSHYSTS